MPQLGKYELNDPLLTEERLVRAEARAKREMTRGSVLVGTQLLRELVEARRTLARLHRAGYGVADDGYPYELVDRV